MPLRNMCQRLRAATLSLVATGGGLVFGGDAAGRFRAFHHETGEVLWEINIGSPVSGFPVSFAVDGRRTSPSVPAGRPPPRVSSS